VPRPQSIPGFAAAQFLDRLPPEAAGGAEDWSEDESATSPGLLAGVEALPDSDADDNEVTRQINIHKTFPGLAFGSAPPAQALAGRTQSAPQQVGASGTYPVRASYPPTALAPGAARDSGPGPVPSVSAAAQAAAAVPSAAPAQPTNMVAVLGIVAGIVAAIVFGLYLSKPSDPGTIHLSTQPKDVRVLVDGKAVETQLSPFVLADLAPEVDHTIAVDKEGYRPWSTRLSVRPGQTLQLPVVSLESIEQAPAEPEPSAAPAPAPVARPVAKPQKPAATSVSTPAVTPSRERPVAASTPRTTSTAAKQAPSAARSAPSADKPTASGPRPVAKSSGGDGAMGTLRINTRPWSEISVDGRRAGNTPQMNLKLPAGKHKITLVNKEFGLKQTLTIDIKPGEVVTKVITLQ